MILSENYKKRLGELSGIKKENKDIEWEYQIRIIDEPIFYKRIKGEEKWTFTTIKDFALNAHKHKIIEWNNDIK
jgi:hypothetical protein